MSQGLLRLCAVADLRDGEMLRVERAAGGPLAVYRIGAEFYVTDDTCTHGQASLVDGELSGFVVTCPFHSGMFDIRTGAVVASPACIPIKIYQTRIEDGSVFAIVGETEPAAEDPKA